VLYKNFYQRKQPNCPILDLLSLFSKSKWHDAQNVDVDGRMGRQTTRALQRFLRAALTAYGLYEDGASNKLQFQFF
jgi:hypothetical protein